MKSKALLFALLLLPCLMAERAFAWDADFCQITSPNDFLSALDGYQDVNEADRTCKTAIIFMNPMVIAFEEPLVIEAAPAQGHNYGTAIRKCVGDGPISEPGCEVTSATDVTLDLRHVSENGGRCPIRIYNGAKVDLMGIRLLVNDPNAAICTGNGIPIPLEDPTNRYAFIHDVTIVGENTPPPPPPTCALTVTPAGRSTNQYELSWVTGYASSAVVTRGNAVPLSTDLNGRLTVASSFYASTYTLTATQDGQECMSSVTIPGRVRPLNRRYSIPFGISLTRLVP